MAGYGWICLYGQGQAGQAYKHRNKGFGEGHPATYGYIAVITAIWLDMAGYGYMGRGRPDKHTSTEIKVLAEGIQPHTAILQLLQLYGWIWLYGQGQAG